MVSLGLGPRRAGTRAVVDLGLAVGAVVAVVVVDPDTGIALGTSAEVVIC